MAEMYNVVLQPKSGKISKPEADDDVKHTSTGNILMIPNNPASKRNSQASLRSIVLSPNEDRRDSKRGVVNCGSSAISDIASQRSIMTKSVVTTKKQGKKKVNQYLLTNVIGE
jgi:hypothetical protein